MDEKHNTTEPPQILSSNDLSFERTILAHERTLMSWVRTSTSMISFGFTIYKFFEEMSKNGSPHHGLFSPRVVGILMILFGFIGLFLAQIQHIIEMRRLKKSYPHVPRSIASFISFLLLVLGLFLLITALARQ